MKWNKTSWNHVFIQNKIDAVKQQWLKLWLTEFFKLKNIVGRLLTVLIGSIIFVTTYFVLRKNGLEGWYGNPIFNKGSAYGSGSQWPTWTVYFLKSLVTLMMLAAFFIFNKWYCYVPVWVVVINSLCIIIDKALILPDDIIYLYSPYDLSNKYHTVVDYFHFPKYVNNIGDIFIISFSVISVISMIISIVKSDIFKDDEKKKEDEVTHEA